MSNGAEVPPELIGDDPERRELDEARRFLVDRTLFRGVLDETLAHAADPARADVPPAPLPALPWVPLGPRNIGGRIRALAQDPRTAAVLYAGSAFGGLWKTTNAGDGWTPLDNFSPPAAASQALPIGAIGIAPSTPSIIYVGTGEPVVGTTFNAALPNGFFEYYYPGSGLYRSSDAGQTFVQIDAPAPAGTIGALRYERILVDPWQPERCFITCPTGFWRREAGPPPTFTQDVIDAPGAPAIQSAVDVAIDFGDRSAAAPPGAYTVYVTLRTQGIYRARFNPASASYVMTGGRAWTKLAGPFPANFHRIRLGLCVNQPRFVYAVFGLPDQSCSQVFKSTDGGDEWRVTATRPNDTDNRQSFTNLLVEVHPDRPEIVFFGNVDLFRSLNGGGSWDKVIDWRNFDSGDRAQHADQHAVVFDSLDWRKVWVANDGGVSMTRDLGRSWRKRSHSILAGQFYDATVHPRFPFMTGGGLQDNGTWVGFGGPTWYYVFGGDGGSMGFDPVNPRRFFVTSQGGVLRSTTGQVTPPPLPGNLFVYTNPVPDVDPPPPGGVMRSEDLFLGAGFAAGHNPTFVGRILHHPTNAGELLVGREQAAYRTTNSGTLFTQLTTGAFASTTGATAEVGALAIAPSAVNTDWWVGTSEGELFMTSDGGVNWNNVSPGGLAGHWVSGIAVHPMAANVVAVSVAARNIGPAGNPGFVFISGDRGMTWAEISGRSAPAGLPSGPSSPAADQLTPGPIIGVAFDPQSPAAGPHTLYIGTLSGVYVVRNAGAPTAAAPMPAAPVWRTFNNGLPLVLIYDVTAITAAFADGSTRDLLRCATLGRGMYECDLGGAPAVRLYVRDHVMDHGRDYANTIPDDPRLAAGTAIVHDRSFDIRVDPPPFSFFEETLDGVEFDLDLATAPPQAGERNLVYVQVHNTGTTAVDAEVHLYVAEAAGAPPRAPDLQAGFWNDFRANPIPGAPWQRIDRMRLATGVGPGQPVVLRFPWTPPVALGGRHAALLAVCSHAQDLVADPAAVPPLVPTLQVDPSVHGAASLIRSERRAALRITPVTAATPDVFVRDGIDDAGDVGAVAWGGRSADIVVVQGAVADPDAAFADPADRRLDDRVRGGVDNHIYVRVHNRTGVPLAAEVELFAIPFATFADHTTWQSLGSANVADAPARGARLAGPIVLASPPDPDPDPARPYKVVLLAALISLAGEAKPDRTAVTDLDSFWRFFVTGARPNDACVRALRFEPAP